MADDEASTTTRFFFDSVYSAAEGLMTVLTDARTDDSSTYEFGFLSAQQVFQSGLLLTGRISKVAAKLEQVPGAVRHDE